MKLLIPTRDRADSLAGVLGFLARFHPDTDVIVADGSQPDEQARIRASLPAGLRVDHRPYPHDLPYFDRLLDVLTGEPDDWLVMGSDDDFPMMDVFEQGAGVMQAEPETVSVQALRLSLTLSAPGQLQARAFPARPIIAGKADRRLSQFSQWPYPTTYGLTRRAHLIDRYERARRGFVPGLFDFAVGAQDCAAGRLRVIPKLGYVTTRTYLHSYMRDSSALFFLRDSGAVLDLMADLHGDLERAGVAPDIAAATAERAIKRLIAAWCGAGPMTRAGFADSDMVRHPQVQAQIALYLDLLRDGSAARAAHLERLRHIAGALLGGADDPRRRNRPGAPDAPDASASAHLTRTQPGPLPLNHRLDPDTLLAIPEAA